MEALARADRLQNASRGGRCPAGVRFEPDEHGLEAGGVRFPGHVFLVDQLTAAARIF